VPVLSGVLTVRLVTGVSGSFEVLTRWHQMPVTAIRPNNPTTTAQVFRGEDRTVWQISPPIATSRKNPPVTSAPRSVRPSFAETLAVAAKLAEALSGGASSD